MKYYVIPALLLASHVTSVFAAEPTLDTENKRFSYTVGFQMAQGLKQQGLDVDADAMILAIRDVLTGAPLKLTLEEMQAASRAYIEKGEKEKKAAAEKNKKAGDAYLAENGKKKGVVTTASGLQYTVIKEGAGKKPLPADSVSVHYRGTLVNGEEFDSSIARGQPVTFPVNGVIQGWQEVLPMMTQGSKWKVVIPASLAYGEHGNNAIEPNQTLIFEIELLSIN
ncbi:MAG: FKBP-type peptidyl-prolyl cis-trans isomerase FklB [Gammaproteobacteria bacterium]|nr:MAG: FKBP-type peptidyl-prolyl cis-trans isomerase FklB [Gammaproteobacteria bacterium]TND06820.1 MAG: FKBP-type peptidyl-prolyl cis-trans isomerase FklB [Gammaproteobacteria bacterium]